MTISLFISHVHLHIITSFPKFIPVPILISSFISMPLLLLRATSVMVISPVGISIIPRIARTPKMIKPTPAFQGSELSLATKPYHNRRCPFLIHFLHINILKLCYRSDKNGFSEKEKGGSFRKHLFLKYSISLSFLLQYLLQLRQHRLRHRQLRLLLRQPRLQLRLQRRQRLQLYYPSHLLGHLLEVRCP